MAINFTTSSEAAKLNGIKVLVYSPAGIGKTTLCSTAPNPIIISAESGMLSIAKDNVPAIEISTVDDLIEVHQMFEKKDKRVASFETICIDSITEIAEVILSNAKKQVKDPRQAYGELIEKMTDTVKAFRDLKGYNIYMAAKEEWTKDEVKGTQTYGPAMPGSKLGQQLPYLFDEVFALRVGKTTDGKEYRYLQTQPDIQYTAKDRSNCLEPIEQPNLTVIFNKILEGVN